MSGPEARSLEELYRETRTIAVVGASAHEAKAAHAVPRYLRQQGYRIIPVNPRGGEILGERVYRSLHEIDVPVDVVDVFRPPNEAEAVARDAVAIGAKVLWFQPGTHTELAVRGRPHRSGHAVHGSHARGARPRRGRSVPGRCGA
ncbi:MAG: CoA-binding protein [Actinomycetota bacterium]